MQELSVMEGGNGESEPVPQESAIAQKSMVIATRDMAAGDALTSWEIERGQLVKELYECTRAHKMSLSQGTYEISKLQMEFGWVKFQETVAKEKLDEALVAVKKLQKEAQRLNSQLRHFESENGKLTTELSSLRGEATKGGSVPEDALVVIKKLQEEVERVKSQLQQSESENRKLTTELTSLRCEATKGESLPETAEKSTTNRFAIPPSAVKRLAEETAPILAEYEMQTKQLQKIENNMETGEGLVTDHNVLEKWTAENEALHTATLQIEELKQRLAEREWLEEELVSSKESLVTVSKEKVVQIEELKQRLAASGRLEADMFNSRESLVKITKEKEELSMRLDAATKEILEYQKRIAQTELHSNEQVRYSEVIDGLNVEKAALLDQLKSLRGELEKQKEDARKARIEASKAVDAERESAKAFKLVQEKEEEIEYYIRQLESLREKNSMLRTQLDMEQQCKEVEMAGTPRMHEQVSNQLSRILNTSMELVASNSIQNPQKAPLEPTSLNAQVAVSAAPKPQKSPCDDSGNKILQDESRKGKSKPATESPDEMPTPEPDAVQQPAKQTVKKSLRLRNRASMQQSMDSGSATTGAIKKVVNLSEEESDDDDGVIEDVTKSKKKSSRSRLQKRPPPLMPNEAETSKKGRRKLSTVRKGKDTDTELGVAKLLAKKSDHRTPLRSNFTPRSGSRLPR